MSCLIQWLKAGRMTCANRQLPCLHKLRLAVATQRWNEYCRFDSGHVYDVASLL